MAIKMDKSGELGDVRPVLRVYALLLVIERKGCKGFGRLKAEIFDIGG